MKYLFLYENYNSYNHKEYLKWKRKNVTFRGTNDTTKPNGPGEGLLGAGLYTAALSNKSMCKQYGDEIYYVVNAIPKNPKKFRNLNEWEIWMQGNLLKPYNYDKNAFKAVTSVKDEMLKLGYDGVIIIGREIVNYTPPDSVRYFRNEAGVIDYYTRTAMEKS